MGVNALYDDARERMLKATLDWVSTPLVMLAYTSNPATSFVPAHKFQSDLGNPYATSQPLTDLNVMPGGYARASSAHFETIPVGLDVQFFVLAEEKPLPADRRLLAFLGDMNNLPLVPNGGSYLVSPDWLFSQGWFRA